MKFFLEDPVNKTIKSYVLRGPSLSQGQKRALEGPLSYLLDSSRIYEMGVQDSSSGLTEHKESKFELSSRLGIWDLGFGDGRSLVHLLKNTQKEWILGSEVYEKGLASVLMKLTKVAKEELERVYLLKEDARLTVKKLREGSLLGVHIFFPDPWPKKRHHKRRLVQKDFVQDLLRVLTLSRAKLESSQAPYIYFVTDKVDYAQEVDAVLSSFSELSCLASPFANDFSADFKPNLRPRLKYEEKALKEGRPIFELYFQRTS